MSMIETACRIAYYLIMGYGVYVCWTAYRCSRKRAWRLLAVYCLSTFLFLGMKSLSKVVNRERIRRASQDQEQPERVVGVSGEVASARDVSLNRNGSLWLPIFPLILVVGLSSLASDEVERSQRAPDPSA